jgi:hypothetical protein
MQVLSYQGEIISFECPKMSIPSDFHMVTTNGNLAYFYLNMCIGDEWDKFSGDEWDMVPLLFILLKPVQTLKFQ